MYYFWLRVLYCAVWVLNALGDGEILIWSQTIKKKKLFFPFEQKKTIFFQFFLSRDNILKGQGPKPRSGYKEKAQKAIHPPKMIMIPLPCFFFKKKIPKLLLPHKHTQPDNLHNQIFHSLSSLSPQISHSILAHSNLSTFFILYKSIPTLKNPTLSCLMDHHFEL